MGIEGVSRFLSKYYFRIEIRGKENLAADSALLVGNHNAAPFSPDTQALVTFYRSEIKTQLKLMTHDWSFKIPVVSKFLKKFGAISCQASSGKQALLEGHHVLIYPGGGWESCRASSERDQVTFKNREGYFRLALDAGVPIVPVVAAGAHDGWWVLTRGNRIADFLKLNRMKIDVFPIALALPFGFTFGPIFPIFPLPRKILISILPPINPLRLIEEHGGSITSANQKVLDLMQKEMDLLVEELPRSRKNHLNEA